MLSTSHVVYIPYCLHPMLSTSHIVYIPCCLHLMLSNLMLSTSHAVYIPCCLHLMLSNLMLSTSHVVYILHLMLSTSHAVYISCCLHLMLSTRLKQFVELIQSSPVVAPYTKCRDLFYPRPHGSPGGICGVHIKWLIKSKFTSGKLKTDLSQNFLKLWE